MGALIKSHIATQSSATRFVNIIVAMTDFDTILSIKLTFDQQFLAIVRL